VRLAISLVTTSSCCRASIHEGALGVHIEDARAEKAMPARGVAELDHSPSYETRAAQYGLGILHMVPQPRSSPAPISKGSAGFGGYVPCAKASAERQGGDRDGGAFHVSPLVEFVQKFVVERAAIPERLVAELALVRGHSFASKARASARSSNTVKWSDVGLLHDLEAHVAGRGAVCLPQDLERAMALSSAADHVDGVTP